MTAQSPNREQIDYWNNEAGPRWKARQDLLDPQIRPIGLAAMDAVGIGAGERVLDVGCGCGDTTLDIARRVGSEGSVLGLDISGPMLEKARERGASLPNVDFRQDDAQTADLGEAAFDLVFSRFGVMFFADPDAAFANLLRALRPGGRLGFACWQEVGRNPYMFEPMAAAARFVELPPRPPEGAPGPFAFADPERVRGILTRAGFEEPKLEDWTGRVDMGDVDRALEFFFEIGPLSNVLRETKAGPEVARQVADAVREVMERYRTPDGIKMPVANWLVTARRS